MIQFFLGAAVMLLFFVAYELGKRQGNKNISPPKEMDKQQRDELKRYNDHFKKLFTYDVEKAIQRKKVT
jgi:hypothetical protein